jgi:hypothetical protein
MAQTGKKTAKTRQNFSRFALSQPSDLKVSFKKTRPPEASFPKKRAPEALRPQKGERMLKYKRGKPTAGKCNNCNFCPRNARGSGGKKCLWHAGCV